MTDANKDPNIGADELRSFLTFRMARVQAKLNAQAMQLLRAQSDLTLVEWRVIQLLRLLNKASMSQLAREIQMDKGQLSRKIKTLVARRIVISEPDKADARQQLLHLSAHGIELNIALMPMMRKRQELLVENINESDLGVFYTVLEKIEAATEIREI
jgi:DNA-binding MarR family transcriptional regulator